MQFGVSIMCTDESIAPSEVARALEDLGFESVFFPEQTHIPLSRRTPWPGGAELPRMYYRVLDPFIAMASAAAATATLRVGSAVCLVAQHDPIVLAKTVATLDHASGGRVLFGVGAGWNREQMENHGTDPSTRFARMREHVLAMRALWSQDEAEFHGDFVDFAPVAQWPKPVQRPGPPVLVGGVGPTVLDRVLEYGEEWFPTRSGTVDELAARIGELRELAAARGVPAPGVTAYRHPPEPELMERFAQLDVGRCVFSVASADTPTVLTELKQLAKRLSPFLG